MITLTRFVVILALATAMNFAVGQTPTQPTKKIVGATVTGRITLQGKGKAGIVVGIRLNNFGPQMAASYKAATDSDGNYRIVDVPPGSYQIAPMAPAYVVSESNAFGGPGKPLLLGEGEKVDNIDFSIVRGAVITGKVTQPNGKPIIDERVYVMDAEQVNQRGVRYVGASFQTDDRGIYRIYGLPAGKYKVCVGADEGSGGSNRSRPVFARVFYPSFSNPDEAKIVELDEGTEAKNIDITVGESVASFALSGAVVDAETNRPVPNLRFGLQKVVENNNTPFFGTSALSNSRGEFRLENITPGKYLVFLMPDQSQNDTRADPVRFEIVDQDVTGVIMKATKGASIAGVVVVEGTHDQTAYAKVAKLRIFSYVRAVEPDAMGFGRVSSIDANGNFRLGGLQAGFATFQLSSPDYMSNTGFLISRVERDGVVQPTPGIEIKAGEQVAGVRVVVTYGNGSVRGTVKWDGPTPAGARMMVRLTKPGENFSGLRPQEVDARGHFIIEGVPAGSYELNVTAFAPGTNVRMPSAKQTVTVTDGAVTTVELVLDSKPITQPNPQ